ncbi:MAG: formate dehydrogenase, partial [Thermodesulfobacteriota bacterium]|nr:formate dehydrogenase [Thermodesulfobacteriota bacterium]
MPKTSKIEVHDKNIVTSLQEFLKNLLKEGDIIGLLVARHLSGKNSVMPTLVTDPEMISGADPLAPAFPINAAKTVSKLTRKPIGGNVAVVLRPCEIRAFIELIKLKQGNMDDVVIIGFDCLGAYGNTHYPRFAGEDVTAATQKFYENALSGKGTAYEDFDISP